MSHRMQEVQYEMCTLTLIIILTHYMLKIVSRFGTVCTQIETNKQQYRNKMFSIQAFLNDKYQELSRPRRIKPAATLL